MVTVRLFNDFLSLSEWSEQQPSSVIISEKTPLLSNLNMVENIALIDEVHHKKSVTAAENNARQALEEVSLGAIAYQRINQCSDMEIFSVLLLRAATLNVERIFILLPLGLVSHTDGISAVIKLIQQLQQPVTVEILDLTSNRIHYQGQACHINE